MQAAIVELKQDYERPGGLQLVEVAGGYQIVTRPDLHEWVRRLFHERSTQRLSVQALETLAVVAYRQPVTSLEITEIRGVNTAGVLEHAARTSPDQDRRAQAGRRPSVHVRDDQGISDSLRAERSERPAQGRRHGRSARHRGAAARRAGAERGSVAARGTEIEIDTDDDPAGWCTERRPAGWQASRHAAAGHSRRTSACGPPSWSWRPAGLLSASGCVPGRPFGPATRLPTCATFGARPDLAVGSSSRSPCRSGRSRLSSVASSWS